MCYVCFVLRRERAASEDQNAAQDSDIIPRQRSVKSFLVLVVCMLCTVLS